MAATRDNSAVLSMRVLLILRILGGAVFLLLSAPAECQQYPFVEIPGLPDCSIPLATAAKGGGYWVAGCGVRTADLFYFDGSRFIGPVSVPIPNVRVNSVAQDGDGAIWLATTAGIYRVNQREVQKLADGAALEGFTQLSPSIFLAITGKSFSPTGEDSELLRFSEVNGKWRVETLLRNFPQTGLTLDHRGHVLYGCNQGFCEFNADDAIRWSPGQALAIKRYATHTAVHYPWNSTVMRDRSGCVWMRKRDTATYLCPGEEEAATLPAETVSLGPTSVLELLDGRIVLPSWSRMAMGRAGDLQVITLRNGYPGAPGRVSEEFPDGSVWLGGKSVLLNRLKMESWSVPEGLDGNTWSILRVGERMFAIAGESIQTLSKDRGRWFAFAKLPRGIHLIEGPGQTILAASLTEGVIQFNLDGQVLRRSSPVQVRHLARSGDGQFWAQENSLSQLVFAGRRILFKASGIPPGWDMKFDAADRLWTCSGDGVGYRDGSGWHSFALHPHSPEGDCSTLGSDRNGDVWYGAGGGLWFLRNPTQQKAVAQKLPGSGPDSFLSVDHRGWVWRGNQNGLFVADLDQAKQDVWLHLDRSSGLPAINMNQNSFLEDFDGSVWFGADNSIVHFTPPSDLLHPARAPTIFVSAFSWGGSPQVAQFVNGFRSNEKVIAYVGSLQFDRRGAIHLRYRILPQQTSWQPASGFDIPLGKLSWGAHKLEVQAQLMDGPWSETTAKSFQVLLPVWLSWPALLVYVAIGSSGAVGAYNWKNKRERRAAKILPALQEFRLAALSPELAQLHGSVLDSRFEVGRVLARGGFATVTEGRDRQQGRQSCAIKIFRQDLVDDDWLRRRFRQEVLALEKIRHPNVVKIYGHGTTPAGVPYLAMEFIDGPTLRELLEYRRPTLLEIASYLLQAGTALAEIHAHGICHRDLKPENFMIRRTASPEQDLVLIDFSIAIVKDPDKTMHGLSRAAGTIYYMAPEQSIGYADSSSDIYSLAKIVIEMMTGERLSKLLPDASMDLPKQVRDLLGRLQAGLSQNSIELISLALEFDPAHRPKDAAGFARKIAMDLRSQQQRTA
jgi:tRNA A-37 threonylcarbamoyl transferase component Bud32